MIEQDVQDESVFPRYLQSYDSMRDHFEEHFEDSNSNERGNRFVEFVHKVVRLTDIGRQFPDIKLSAKKSHDGGVDLFSATSEDGETLYIQSKYKIKSKDDIDLVFSKFQNIDRELKVKGNKDLFAKPDDKVKYMLITSSNADGAFDNYEKSSMSSVSFYKNLRADGRVHVIRGDGLLEILRTLYRKSHLIPQKFALRSIPGWISSDCVNIGIVKTKDISELYKEHGDALFFENIREFLGIDRANAKDRDYVNQEIVVTLTESPARMLAKNNGLTIRASSVERVDSTTIMVSSGAIVNGCQTTNCISLAPESDLAEVLVKVVASEDGWDVAQSANYQNPVARIDLEIAKYVRPALVQKYAASIGYDIKTESDSSVSAVIGRIYRNTVNYDAIKTLFLGIFSKKPNNMFQGNYTEISRELIGHVFDGLNVENEIFRVLFMAVTAGDEALSKHKSDIGDMADIPGRMFDETKHSYRMILLLLALSACANEDISAKEETMEARSDRIVRFLASTRKTLESDKELFNTMYKIAFMIMIEMFYEYQDVEKAQKDFYNKVARLDFSGTLKKIHLRVKLK